MAIKKSTKKTVKNAYSAESIQVLEGLDPVRKRPGMYIGSTGPQGLHHLIWEVVDNGIDEAMAGHANDITITLHPDNVVSVTDNGRGIPVDIHKQFKKSALELVMTKLHAGGKFGGGGYKVSGGLHGVGVSVVNALSSWTKAEVHRDGKIWVQEYIRGKPKAKVKPIGKAKATQTTISFKPDDDIFTTTVFEWPTILDHIRQQAYLTKGVAFHIHDVRDAKNPLRYDYYFEGGIKSYVRHLNHHKERKHQNVFYVDKEVEGRRVEVALQYVNDYKENTSAFANNIFNPEGGMHLVGFRTALTRTINHYARAKGLLKEKDAPLSGDDCREGMTAIISVKLEEPQFEGQTKGKLGNDDMRPLVDQVFSESFATFLEEHPRDAEAIIGKALLAARARAAAKMARDSVLRKGALEGLTLPGKLADCSSRKAENSELFIVEGDSAGGSSKQGRDRETQAILPLRGKVLNVERARLDKLLANTELKSLIIAIGTNIGEQFDLEKLRYNKIIIMTDADVDGAHIRTLLLTFFWRHLTDLVKAGHLYIAQPPLYQLKKGKVAHYAYTDEEKEKYLAEFEKSAKKPARDVKEKSIAKDEEEALGEGVGEKTKTGVNIQRYKGLGEMNPEQLWETTMDPATRQLMQVTVDDVERADETFTILMGADVAPRKKFISTHAKYVQNLDI